MLTYYSKIKLKEVLGAGEMAYQLRILVATQQRLELRSQCPQNKPDALHIFIIPAPRRQRQEDCWGLLPSSLAEKCNPQVQGETLSQRNRGKVIKEDSDAFWPLSITGMCTNTQINLELFISSIGRKNVHQYGSSRYYRLL